MKIIIIESELLFRVPFVISHGTRTHTSVVFLEIHAEGVVGYGEAALPPYLSESSATVSSYIKSHESQFPKWMKDPESLKSWMGLMDTSLAAKACIEMAILDWIARKEKISLGTLLDIQGDNTPLCSLTIGAGTDAELADAIRAHPQFKLFKLKLTGKGDLDRVRKARALTDRPMAVDINGGWKNADEAVALIDQFKELGVILVEQPFPKTNRENYLLLKDRSALPIIADESITTYTELEERYSQFNGVNIKLMKCPGLYQALKMIRFCKEKQLKILIGCMSESSCGAGAAAALSPLADWLDLDGPRLISNDPFSGISYVNGQLVVEGKTGTGVSKRQ